MTIGWPAAFLIVMLVFVALIALSEPSRKRHEIRMTELKAKGNEQFEVLADKYEQLAAETRETQASMRTDIGAIRTSVESIEQMMRDVG
jgi:uncharacterized protein YlxW (UPF0749 family)